MPWVVWPCISLWMVICLRAVLYTVGFALLRPKYYIIFYGAPQVRSYWYGIIHTQYIQIRCIYFDFDIYALGSYPPRNVCCLPYNVIVYL